MAAISQTIFSDDFCVNGNICILIKISMKFVPKCPIDNNTSLLQPLSEPLLILFTDAYMQY